jgi:hypothetical protein
MVMHRMDTLSETMEANRKDGYTFGFKMQEGGLLCEENGKVYQAQDLRIVGHHRFEGVSNPDDMSAIYLIEANDGVKGMIIDAFGTYSDQDLSEFLHAVPVEEDGN